jgi:HEAT repeat protein/Cdc6-like AAA superfamily ATPase
VFEDPVASDRKSYPQRPAEELFAICQSVRELASKGEIAEALDRLLVAPAVIDTAVRSELGILSSRLVDNVRRENEGLLASEQAGIERTKITRQLFTIIDSLEQTTRRHSLERALSPKEVRARNDYIAAVRRDVWNRLNNSIHRARLIDLGLQDTPEAVYLPWVYTDSATRQSFQNFNEAFEAYGRRLLILGGPGSGKTVTILHIALRLIDEAEKDQASPIPLIVNLSKLDIRSSSSSSIWPFRLQGPKGGGQDKAVENWLGRELVAYPFISNELSRVWLEEGRIAALLDGLDEVDDSYRAEIATLLNATYLRDHPNGVVVIGSRINEYKPLQDEKSSTLNLNGSITLQPFSHPQITEYLEKAGAVGLREVLFNDDTLYQLAQVPLTLSMLTLAYGRASAAEIPSSGSLTERRHRIMERYVAKMLQRKARRDCNVQFDENPQNDVSVSKYPYVPERLNHYLGWLAIRLSVRMQTAVSPNRMYSFLDRQINRDQRSGVWWGRILARSPVLVLTGVGAATLAPTAYPGWQFVLAGMVLSIASYLAASWPLQPNYGQSKTAEAIKIGFCSIFIAMTVGVDAGSVSLALSSTLPGALPPIAAGIMGICAALAIVVVVVSAVESSGDEVWYYLFAGGTLVLLIAAMLLHDPTIRWRDWYFWSGCVVGFQACFAIALLIREEGLKEWPLLAMIPVGVGFAVIFLVASTWIADHLSWRETFLVFVLTAAVVLALVPRPVLMLGGLSASLLFGHQMNGPAGGVIAMAAYGVLATVVAITIEIDRPVPGVYLTDWEDSPTHRPTLKQFVAAIIQRAEDAMEAFYNPILLRVLAVMQYLPIRFSRFCNYAVNSLLLKRAAEDIEFVHRLLRDYFALRDLQPLLVSSDAARRLQAVRYLGFQGEAAIGPLAEFVRDENAETREAAAWAFGRLASPEIVQYLQVALVDEVPQVRATAVLSTKIIPRKDRSQLLSAVVDDSDFMVQKALVQITLETAYLPTFWLLDFSDKGDKWHRVLKDTDDTTRKIIQHIRERSDLQQVVIQLIGSGDEFFQHGAMHIAAGLNDSRAVPAIISVLQNRKSHFRDDAARSLGGFPGDDRAIKALTRAAKDWDRRVRASAAKALSECVR